MKKILGAFLIVICLLCCSVFVSAEEYICTTYNASDITHFSAKLNGCIMVDFEDVSEYGFIIAEVGGQDKKIVLKDSLGANVDISHTAILISDTEYSYKTYLKTKSNDTIYGETITFKTMTRQQNEMPVLDFNISVTNPKDIDIIKTPNMFYLNNLIVNQKDKLQLIAGHDFYGQDNVFSVGEDSVLLNQFFMNNYYENAALKFGLSLFDVLYNFDGYLLDTATTTLVIPDAVAKYCDKSDLSDIIYKLCGDLEYKRYIGALNEAIKCDYTSSDKRTFGFEQGNYVQQAAIVDVVNKSKQLIESPEKVYNSLSEAADDYVNKILPSYILSGSRALEMTKYISTEANDLTTEQKNIYLKYISNYLNDYRKYSNWNFSDAELETLQNSFESEFYSPNASVLAKGLGFALEATANTVNSNATTEQLIHNKDLLKDLFLRLKNETKNSKLGVLLGDYAEKTELSLDDNFHDMFTNISSAFVNSVIKAPIEDIVEDKISVSIMNMATSSNEGASFATMKNLATLNYAKLAVETGLFFTDKISGTKTFLEKTIELKYLYNIENDSLSMLQKDLNAYELKPTEEGAEKVLKDLTWIRALRLRGITIVNDMYQSNSKSLLGGIETKLGAYPSEEINAVFVNQKDALIRASLYENGYTMEPLVLEWGDKYTIFKSDESADPYNGALNGVSFSDACSRLAGGVTLKRGSALTISSADLYIPYIINEGGTLHIIENSNVVVGQFIEKNGDNNISGRLIVETDLVQKGTITLNHGYIEVGGDYLRNGYGPSSVGGFSEYSTLNMKNEDDYILVKGNYSESEKTAETLTAGTIEIKGDMLDYAYYNQSEGTHKTILSGDEGQEVSVKDGARFNILEIANTSDEGVTFNYNVYINKEVYSDNSTINNANKIYLSGNAKPRGNIWNYDITLHNWIGEECIEFGGNVYFVGNVRMDEQNIIKGNLETSSNAYNMMLTINESQIVMGSVTTRGSSMVTLNKDIIINGDLTQRGTITLNNGYIEVGGNYLRFASNISTGEWSHGTLNMMHEDDYILVKGNYSARQYAEETLTAGTIEIKGDVLDYAYYNQPEGTHKTILSGDEGQEVSVKDGARFNILEIANTSDEGVTFNYNVYVSDSIRQPTGTKIVNFNKVMLQNRIAFVDYGTEINTAVNKFVGNHENVIPTWLDYQEYNINQEIIATKGIKLSAVSTTTTETSVSGTVRITNNDKDYEDAQLIVAVYSGEKLIGVCIINIDSSKETQTIKNYIVNCWESIDHATLKVMLWYDLEDLVPLCDFVQTNVVQ